jgi:hypothetical protein
MAPIANALLFVGLALALRVAAIRWPALCSTDTVVFSLSSIGAYGILRSGEHIHGAAAVILALGFGAVAARALSSRAIALHYWGIGATPALGGLTLAVALAGSGLGRWTERRLLDAPSELPENTPNVLLITLDTVRARSLSLYGYARSTTPRLEMGGQRRRLRARDRPFAMDSSDPCQPVHRTLSVRDVGGLVVPVG